MTTYYCIRGDRKQILLCGDIQDQKFREKLYAVMPKYVNIVYSDPPWNPGNATYWRTHAGFEPCNSYHSFLDSWVEVVSKCRKHGAQHILCEQSANDHHSNMLLDAIARSKSWDLPLLEEFIVYYGTPGSKSVSRPNKLYHFALTDTLATDPTGMSGEAMTIRVCAGLKIRPGIWICDPCMGKGMISRMAHYFDSNCIGSELNPKRLDVTLKWLQRAGYIIQEQA